MWVAPIRRIAVRTPSALPTFFHSAVAASLLEFSIMGTRRFFSPSVS